MEGVQKPPTTVLVVDADAEERDQLSSWLEASGFDVFTCPGPTGPDYTCVGSRGDPCPLVHPADVVVLDLWLSGDEFLIGTPSEELLGFYLASGKPVVALGYEEPILARFVGEPVAALERHPERTALIEAVRDLAAGPIGPNPGLRAPSGGDVRP